MFTNKKTSRYKRFYKYLKIKFKRFNEEYLEWKNIKTYRHYECFWYLQFSLFSRKLIQLI